MGRLRAALEAPAAPRGISRGLEGEVGPNRVELRDRGRTVHSARTTFRGEWKSRDGGVHLEGAFQPSPRALRFIKVMSVALALLVAASAWVLLAPDEPAVMKFLIPMASALSVFLMPLLVLGLASQREAEEARIAKAIRVALAEEDPGLPPQQRWADEE